MPPSTITISSRPQIALPPLLKTWRVAGQKPGQGSRGSFFLTATIRIVAISISPSRMPGTTPAMNRRPTELSVVAA